MPLNERMDLGLIRLYIDDLEWITILLRKCFGEVRIKADTYEVDEPNELINPEIRQLDSVRIDATKPLDPNSQCRISIELSRRYSELNVTIPDLAVKSIVSDIKDHVSKRRRLGDSLRRANPIKAGLVFGGTIALISTALNFGLRAENVPATDRAVVAAVVMSLFTVTILTLTYAHLELRTHAIIVPKYEKDGPSFWKRNKDQLLINLGFTLLGAILGFLSGLALND